MRDRPALFVFLVLILPAFQLCGQQAGTKPMEPRHVANIQYVTSAVISPDGEHVAYTVAVPRRVLDEDDGPAWSQLFVATLHGADSTIRPFIVGDVSIGNPRWTPDGRWIYYTAKRNGDKEKTLYRIAVDGGESIPSLKHATSIEGFDIAPDGRTIAFLAKPEPDPAAKLLREKGLDQQIYEEDWKPTSVWIAELNPDVTTRENVQKPRKLDLKGSASVVQWSPSGKELMVVLAPTPSVDDSYMYQRVHVIEADNGRTLRSINNPGKLGQVTWSPDGKRLAIVSGADIHDPHEGRLMVANIDGEEGLHDLMPQLEAQVGAVAWKDNSTLYWLAADGVSSRFGSVDLSGRRTDLIEPGGDTVFVGFSRAHDNDTLAMVGHAPTHPAELFTAGDAGEMPQRVTHLNPWLSELRFAKQTPVRFQARDGLDIEGVLVYPLGYVEGRRYPTIMYVHGGPESHESNGWLTSYTRPGQVAAARGFAVFYPNYRGSTGRGVDFSKLGQADAAGKEFDDLVDGIDHLIDNGIADRDAIGVTGGSYGGYASAWCATFYSDRFAASVMFVGISDNVSKVGTTDIPEEMFLVHHRKRLWEDWDYFLERSPIHFVERNKTPTLILHGKNDPRVHPSQSLELHRHLKTLDQAPVRLVLYEGEGHGNRKAAARLDYHLRMLRWMEHFLQDKAESAPQMELDYRQELGLPEEENPLR
jgi:dipeptidyl aminopeptidase/acylaminoacyl peptidase